MNTLKISLEIAKSLDEIDTILGSCSGNAEWTEHVVRRLTLLSKTFRVDAAARGQPSPAKYGEWLYDICWYQMDDCGADNCLKRVVLAGECEWNAAECDVDFQKLLQARADLRLWIFQPRDASRNIPRWVANYIRNIKTFEGSLPGDQYLFAGYDDSKGLPRFQYSRYVYPNAHEESLPR